ncbi:uncharacterized protein EI90DRAFT_1717907 [Cantharellus anzutake]|uniref:uncharacterized protein n=1 Tax=Cantharellus anzutake TaxID=1750568 RepID=UPI0019071B29|nr:uncharacterized protein EI90DRAFT_1717907 [Cantharellus anzutake]KAF8341303.1 hypothetical protein EI90DRAFT_1717907 [Cantharellus anzutake]
MKRSFWMCWVETLGGPGSLLVLTNLALCYWRLQKTHRHPSLLRHVRDAANLPVRHEGGQLVVRAPVAESSNTSLDRKEYTTQWGSGANFEWIAFFSDCEPEVLLVTSSHRVTLSYTLSFDRTSNDNASFGAEILAESLGPNLNFSPLHDALAAPVISPKNTLVYASISNINIPAKACVDLVNHKLKGRDAVLYHMLIQTASSSPFTTSSSPSHRIAILLLKMRTPKIKFMQYSLHLTNPARGVVYNTA